MSFKIKIKCSNNFFFIILRMSLKIFFKPPLILFTDKDGGYQSLAHTLTKINI